MAKALMVLGTGSFVGKSILVAALCRIFTQAGYRVRPFKAQNMALNSFVTPEGGEIGRAQAVQAAACRVPPSVLMNPILLKPAGEAGCQVVLLGKPLAHMEARDYFDYKERLLPVVEDSLRELASQCEVLIMEGAGSPAEVNLKEHDLVNLKAAELAGAPCLLVGDIERGGVFAWLLGTLDLLSPEERARVKGFIINKFRGDSALLEEGLKSLEARSGIPVLGVVPFLHGIHLPEEDSQALPPSGGGDPGGKGLLEVRVLRLPRISNFTDFDPLSREPGVRLRYIEREEELRGAHLVIVPGTKSTMADLEHIESSGLARALREIAAGGGIILGVCGGYQMLGESLRDPFGVESPIKEKQGLGLLPITTTFEPEKATHQVEALHLESGEKLEGYEIHMGRTQREAPLRPLFRIKRKSTGEVFEEGAVNEAGNIMGTYVHGLFDSNSFRRAFLRRLRERLGLSDPGGEDAHFDLEEELDELALRVREALDMDRVCALLKLPPLKG